MAHSFRGHGDISSTPMIPHGGGPSSYRLPEMTQDTPRITFEGSRRSGRRLRIIPARAGFTRPPLSPSPFPRDHPRSRGVYRLPPVTGAGPWGSSPLARGLLGAMRSRRPGRRIIPARAGFTSPPRPAGPRDPDHPRSRGVYAAVRITAERRSGSSPLARGLPERDDLVWPDDRIIPARAGFTSLTPATTAEEVGSSPLARGLHLRIVGIPTNP